ncbi:hypothetical protein ABPG72_013982 [Tetrahymena utriculariae]
MAEVADINQQSTQIGMGNKKRVFPNKGVKFVLYPNCQEECQIQSIHFLQQSLVVFMMEIIFYLATGGLGLIILHWVPMWRFKLFFKIVDEKEATEICVFGPDNDLKILKFLKIKERNDKIFQYRFQRYIYQDNMFVPFFENVFEMKNSEIIQFPENNVVDASRINVSHIKNGMNQTDIPDQGLFVMCMLELFTPFYFFQIGSCILWFFEGYIYYAYIILCCAFLGYWFGIFEERTNFLRLKKFSYQRYQVSVVRNGEKKGVLNNEVIFGDIVELKKGEVACCDLIVTQGSVIVNESMLTGESIPIVKTPIQQNDEKFHEIKNNVIYSGSVILQTSNLRCQAFRLGFETLRGNLIRSIMYPKKHSQISFTKDSLFFILIMGLCAFISFMASVKTFMQKLDDGMIEIQDVVLRCFDLVTISVPPALPTCLSFGVSFSMRRLARRKIYCINHQKINICGIVRIICFDKTGTLTESLLSFKMVSAYEQGQFKEVSEAKDLSKIQRLIIGACHTLQNFNGQSVGDPLDQEMFNNSGWKISDKTEEELQKEGNGAIQEIYDSTTNEKIEVLKSFQFESEYERMSTVVRYEGETYLLTKGAPERLKTISNPQSIPSGNNENGYIEKLRSYTQQGYRVISLCYKKIDANSIGLPRDQLEQGLNYVGYLIFENKLKPETIPNIQKLQEAKIQIHMVTGDNPITSLNIAKQCQLLGPNQNTYVLDYINHRILCEVNGVSSEIENLDSILQTRNIELVITGNFFNKFFGENEENLNIQKISTLLYLSKVYARMKPNQKQSLIRLMQKYANKKGYTFIGMCGDGANDCSALKDADMGISLGEAEASIAASFTSKILNISAAEYALREGRCCLTTSFQCFKFMALYSMIQVSTTAILYQRGSVPSDFQFLYWDLFIIFPLAFLLGLTESSDKLNTDQPTHRLFSPPNVISVAGLGIIQICFQIIIVAVTSTQSWYIDPITFQNENGMDPSDLLQNSFDNTVLYWIANFQYITCIIAFSLGSVHKKPFYTNKYFTIYLGLITSLSIYMLYTNQPDVVNFFMLQPQLTTVDETTVITEMAYKWRWAVLGFILLNSLINITYEKYICKALVRKLESKYPKLVYEGVSTVPIYNNAKNNEESNSLKLDNQLQNQSDKSH